MKTLLIKNTIWCNGFLWANMQNSQMWWMQSDPTHSTGFAWFILVALEATWLPSQCECFDTAFVPIALGSVYYTLAHHVVETMRNNCSPTEDASKCHWAGGILWPLFPLLPSLLTGPHCLLTCTCLCPRVQVSGGVQYGLHQCPVSPWQHHGMTRKASWHGMCLQW